MLKQVVYKCLEECTRLKVKSLSMPSIGAGNLIYPIDVVARVLMEETASFFQKNQGKTSLQLVHFVIFDQKIYDAFQLVYENWSSPTSTNISSSVTPPSHHNSTSSFGSHQRKVRASSQSACSFPLPHGLSLELLQGDISDDDSDAIVNTTQENLKLVGGGVSGALLKKGGQALQDACDSAVAKGKTPKEGKVVFTRATGSLKCKEVFHIAVRGEKNLSKTVFSCLELAEEKRFSSISFPAIGTGLLNCAATSVSKEIIDALQKFISSKPKHVKVIRMIVFQAHVYKDFVTAFDSIGSGGLMSYFYYSGVRAVTGTVRAVKSIFVSSSDSNDDEDKMELETNNEDEEFENLSENENGAAMVANLSLDSEVMLHIYGETDSTVGRAKKRLHSIIDTTSHTEKIEHLSITAFSDEMVHELESLASDQHVEIEIDRDPNLHSINLQGLYQDIMYVKDKIHDAMSSITQEQSNKAAAALVSKTVCWIRINPDNEEEEEYGEKLNYEIEQAFQMNNNSFDATDENFSINFVEMEERDNITKKTTIVKRLDLTKEQGM